MCRAEASPRVDGVVRLAVGRDAAADALAHAWVHWDVVSVTENRLGYVYGVGRNMARRMLFAVRLRAGQRRAVAGR